MELNSIDQIIASLEGIVLESKNNEDPLGYFAVLYQKVTIKVKEGIDNDFFDDGARMEELDVVFANRYINAYHSYQENKAVTSSWNKAFELSTKYWPIVLQHLLIGINAHISLDLGIAAAEISRGKNIDDLENDFNKINEILSSLVNEVQNDLAEIWPTLKKILKRTRRADDFLIDFSMELARDGAWKFAKNMVNKPIDEWDSSLVLRDQKVSQVANSITNPGLVAKVILSIIRLGERGSVSEKITKLEK